MPTRRSTMHNPLYKSLVFISIFALLGATFVFISKAATNVLSSEAESGVVSDSSMSIIDSQASNGNAVKFLSSQTASSWLFNGDFETGNLSQWPMCHNLINDYGDCNTYDGTNYALQIQSSVKRQGNYAARFEVRDGDTFSGIQRSDIGAYSETGGTENDERWYQWSTLFSPGFPTSDPSDGSVWGLVSQWHPDTLTGSPPVSFNVDVGTGQWGLRINPQSSPGTFVNYFVVWKAPLDAGNWQDIKMHIKWSASDSVGYVELWHDGVQQTFTGAPCAGQTRCTIRTLIPGTGGTYFKQGYYRCLCDLGTAVVYHDGFSAATTEAGLAPL